MWERRLTREAKLRRALVIVAMVALALAVLLASTGIPQAAWQRATAAQRATAVQDPAPTITPVSWPIPPQLPSYPRGTLTMTGWQTIPVPDSGRSQMSFTPFPSDPASIFGCTAARNIPGQGPLAGPVKLLRTRDAGQHWQQLPLPALTADTCIVRIAADAPQRVLLLTYTSGDPTLCQSPALFVSENSGDTWTPLTPPHLSNSSPNLEDCDAWATGAYLFWYETVACQPNQPTPCNELLRSTDGGKTWAHADTGLATTGDFSPVWTNDNGGQTLLAAYSPQSAPATATPNTALWVSYDAGNSWQPFGTNFAHMALTRTYISLEPGLSPIAGDELYRELIGPVNTNLHNVAQSQNGGIHQWVTLPPLPMPGTDAYHDGIAQIIGVTSDIAMQDSGALVVFGPDPRTGVALLGPDKVHDTPAADWLWVWNSQTWQWEAAPAPLPVQPEDASLSWGAEPGSNGENAPTGTFVWITSPSAKGTSLIRAFLPRQ